MKAEGGELNEGDEEAVVPGLQDAPLVQERLNSFVTCHGFVESTHETTGFSPSILMFGREMRLPIDAMRDAPPLEEPRLSTFCEEAA